MQAPGEGNERWTGHINSQDILASSSNISRHQEYYLPPKQLPPTNSRFRLLV